MRKLRTTRFDHVLAGTVLALAVAAPGAATLAAPNAVRSAPPPPPSVNTPSHRDLTQTPPPSINPPARRDAGPTPPPAPAPAQTTDSGGSDSKGAPDKPLAASDAQIAEKLRAMVTGKRLDKRVTHLPERSAIEALYTGRNFEPLWIKDGRLTAHAKAVIGRLKNAGADGLDPADYPIPEFGTANGAEALAEGDVTLAHSLLAYARHLQTGRIAPTRVSVEVDYGNHTPEPADILKAIANASDVNATLENFNPPHAGFKALKTKLAEMRANAGAADTRIPDGPMLKAGMKDARVPQLRERLGLAGHADDTSYDGKLADAVKRVQSRADLPPRGWLDSKTLAAINGPKPSQQIEKILATMERWRWLPRDLGKTYVMVNIPDFTLKVVRDRDVIWRTKIVAGKPQTPTPLTSAPMDHVIVNPSWYVPQSIIQNELLPLYDNDPQVFARMGLEVKRGPDGNINVVQPPGAANALGRIKFAFPNKFQVYLHDTPEKRLFAHERRAFSHGCMRVEDPTKFGELLLSISMHGATPNSQQIYAMFGHEERTYKLVSRPMVHLTYQTAFVDDAGKLVLRDDLYGFDARIHTILNSDERRIADVAPPVDPKRDLATLKNNQEILRRVERREALNPLLFFERLFR